MSSPALLTGMSWLNQRHSLPKSPSRGMVAPETIRTSDPQTRSLMLRPERLPVLTSEQGREALGLLASRLDAYKACIARADFGGEVRACPTPRTAQLRDFRGDLGHAVQVAHVRMLGGPPCPANRDERQARNLAKFISSMFFQGMGRSDASAVAHAILDALGWAREGITATSSLPARGCRDRTGARDRRCGRRAGECTLI